jgi:serralysin
MKRIFLSKTISRLGVLATLAAIVGTGVQQTVQAQPPSATPTRTATPQTIAEIVVQSGGEYDNNNQDFDILLNAVKQTNLVDALAAKDADLTVFAPTDEAFLKLSRFFGYKGNDESAVLDVINKEFTKANQLDVANGGSNPNAFNLRDVLLYHVSPSAKNLNTLQNLPGDKSMETLLNYGDRPINAYRISYINGNLIDPAPNLMAPKIQQHLQDIQASNGVIQGIDRVLFPFSLSGAYPVLSRTQQAGQPLTIADVLAQSGSGYDDNRQDFDILNKLLQTAELTDLFADPKANLTLFAPTDAAFVKFTEFISGGAYQGSDNVEDRAYYLTIDLIQRVDQVTTQNIYVGGDAVPLLQKALQYHVSTGAKTAAEIQAASSIATLLNGAAITPQKGDRANPNDFTNSQFQLGNTYARTTNGVIQSIDNVLVPSIEQIK